MAVHLGGCCGNRQGSNWLCYSSTSVSVFLGPGLYSTVKSTHLVPQSLWAGLSGPLGHLPKPPGVRAVLLNMRTSWGSRLIPVYGFGAWILPYKPPISILSAVRHFTERKFLSMRGLPLTSLPFLHTFNVHSFTSDHPGYQSLIPSPGTLFHSKSCTKSHLLSLICCACPVMPFKLITIKVSFIISLVIIFRKDPSLHMIAHI